MTAERQHPGGILWLNAGTRGDTATRRDTMAERRHPPEDPVRPGVRRW